MIETIVKCTGTGTDCEYWFECAYPRSELRVPEGAAFFQESFLPHCDRQVHQGQDEAEAAELTAIGTQLN